MRASLMCVCQRPVEIGGNPGLGAFFVVEWWLQRAVEIALNKVVKRLFRVAVLAPAEKVEPLRAIGHMGDFFGIDLLLYY